MYVSIHSALTFMHSFNVCLTVRCTILHCILYDLALCMVYNLALYVNDLPNDYKLVL